MNAMPFSEAPAIEAADAKKTGPATGNQESNPHLPGPPNLVKDDSKWFAIYTRSRFEKKLYRALRQSAFHAFLPLIKEKRLWSDRIKSVLVPLLPSYVFIKTPWNQLHQVYGFPGVVKVVSFEGRPCVVREEEISLLEQIVAHGFKVQKATNCEVGDVVRIVRGPLCGWEGRVESKMGKSRVVFRLEAIRQAIGVEVGVGDVEVVE